MAYVVVRTRREAEQVADVMTDLNGYQPTIFRDGKEYVVQHNELSREAVERALFDRGLTNLLGRDALSRIEWERTRPS